MAARGCMHNENKQWSSWGSIPSDIAVLTSQVMKFVILWSLVSAILSWAESWNKNPAWNFLCSTWEVCYWDIKHALDKLTAMRQWDICNVLSGTGTLKAEECPWRTTRDLEDLPQVSPLEIWRKFNSLGIKNSSPELDYQSRVQLQHFEMFEGGYLVKMFWLVEHEESSSSKWQCTLSLSSPRLWVSHHRYGITTTPTLFCQI